MKGCNSQRLIENTAQNLRRSLALRLVAQLCLGDLDIPVAVFRPEEVIDLAACLAKLIVVNQARDLADQSRAAADDPAVGQRLGLKSAQRRNAATDALGLAQI